MFLRRVKTLIKQPFWVKAMLLKILFMSAYYRFKILYGPFAKLAPKIGKQGVETPQEITISDEEMNILRKVSWAVPAVCKRTPWQSKCLVQAIIAKKLLNKKNIKCTLYMGVRNDPKTSEMLAHAWLRVGRYIITGIEGHELFTVTGKFGDE